MLISGYGAFSAIFNEYKLLRFIILLKFRNKINIFFACFKDNHSLYFPSGLELWLWLFMNFQNNYLSPAAMATSWQGGLILVDYRVYTILINFV